MSSSNDCCESCGEPVEGHFYDPQTNEYIGYTPCLEQIGETLVGTEWLKQLGVIEDD